MSTLKQSRHWRSAFFGALIAGVLLLGIPAVADIGDPVIQGRFNAVDKRTTLTGSTSGDSQLKVINTAADGTGINIRVEPGQAPLVVNRSTRVKKLNADRLDGRHARDFVSRNSAFSCAGTAFEAIDSTTPYNTLASLKYRSAATGNSIFRCSAELPNGVFVDAVTFAVRDSSAGEAASCQMWRTDMTDAVGSEESMASVTTSGEPGDVALTDTSIANAKVDTRRYSYFVQCSLGSDSSVGVYGAIVEYGTTAPAAPAAVEETPAAASTD